MAELHTERLLLRNITENDTDDIYAYACSPNVGPNAGWKPHESREETLAVMKTVFLNHETVWGIILKESNKLIGSIGLMEDAKRQYKGARMIGYAIGEPYWGTGYTTEAAREVIRYSFEVLKIDLVSAYCYPFNARSKNVMRKCGLLYEGTLKMAEKIFSGELYDNECYAITRDEYLRKEKNP